MNEGCGGVCCADYIFVCVHVYVNMGQTIVIESNITLITGNREHITVLFVNFVRLDTHDRYRYCTFNLNNNLLNI